MWCISWFHTSLPVCYIYFWYICGDIDTVHGYLFHNDVDIACLSWIMRFMSWLCYNMKIELFLFFQVFLVGIMTKKPNSYVLDMYANICLICGSVCVCQDIVYELLRFRMILCWKWKREHKSIEKCSLRLSLYKLNCGRFKRHFLACEVKLGKLPGKVLWVGT